MSTPTPPPPNQPQWQLPHPTSQQPYPPHAPGVAGPQPFGTVLAPPPPKKRGLGFWLLIGVLVIVGLVFVSCTAAVVGGAGNSSAKPASVSTSASRAAQDPTTRAAQASEEPTDDPGADVSEDPVDEPTSEPTKQPEPKPTKKALTSGQENAIGTAQDYLDYTAFSKKGLIKQLKFEGYSEKDSKFAASYLDIDWKKQAVKSGEQYLDYTHFSQSGLVQQLEFEGFTHDQAVYGAKKALR